MAEMIHFIRQLQTYCHLAVIECQWKKLTEFIQKKEGGLDALISAHRNYVNAVDKKVLLYYPKSGKEVIGFSSVHITETSEYSVSRKTFG